MKLARVFHGVIRQGQIKLDDLRGWASLIKAMEGKEVSVTLKLRSKEPSDPQRRYYFGVVVELCAEHLGYTKDEMHDAFKAALLMDNTGPIPKIGRFSTLDSAERTKFIDDARRLAAEVGCYTPEPGQVEVGAGW